MAVLNVCLLAGILAFSAGPILAQSQSPDQQQEKNGDKGSSKAHQPKTDSLAPNAGPSPDTQQEKNGSTQDSKHKKNRNNARQAHGTPDPQSTKSPQL